MFKMNFKEFLLSEKTNYLAEKIGDVLTDTQRLRDESQNMGSRDLTRFSERIVKKIRDILHSSWPESNKKHLYQLRKMGANIMMAVDPGRKNTTPKDLPSIISAVASNLEKLVADIGSPINKLAVDTDQESPETETGNVEKEIKPTPKIKQPQPKQPQPKQDQQGNMPPKDQSAPPPVPQVKDQAPNAASPPNADPNAISAPGLGGSSGPLSAF